MRNFAVLLTLLACPNLATAALVFGYAGQNLMFDTESGLIWLPPTASPDEVEALSNYGRGLRVATVNQVNGLLTEQLAMTNFFYSDSVPIDPVGEQFFEFAMSGSNDALGGLSLSSYWSWWTTDGFFAWADNYDVPSADSSYAFTGYTLGYGGLDGPPNDFDGLWITGYSYTLGIYPIDPCDTEDFSACTTSAFRVMRPVPLPGALPLLVTAIAASGFLRRRSRPGTRGSEASSEAQIHIETIAS